MKEHEPALGRVKPAQQKARQQLARRMFGHAAPPGLRESRKPTAFSHIWTRLSATTGEIGIETHLARPALALSAVWVDFEPAVPRHAHLREIGRASCRERV